LSFRDKEQQTEEPCEATSLTHGFGGGGGQATDLPKPTPWTCCWARSDYLLRGVRASRRPLSCPEGAKKTDASKGTVQ